MEEPENIEQESKSIPQMHFIYKAESCEVKGVSYINFYHLDDDKMPSTNNAMQMEEMW